MLSISVAGRVNERTNKKCISLQVSIEDRTFFHREHGKTPCVFSNVGLHARWGKKSCTCKPDAAPAQIEIVWSFNGRRQSQICLLYLTNRMSGLVIQTKELTIFRKTSLFVRKQFMALHKLSLAVRIGAKLQIKIKHTTALTLSTIIDR